MRLMPFYRTKYIQPRSGFKTLLAQHDMKRVVCKDRDRLSYAVRLRDVPPRMTQHGFNFAGISVSIPDDERGDLFVVHGGSSLTLLARGSPRKYPSISA